MNGAHDWNRTSDLLLTKEVLYRLSYVSSYLALIRDGKETGRHPAGLFNKTSTILHDCEEQTSIHAGLSTKSGPRIALQWSGRRESNPRNQFGKLMFYH